MALSQVSTIVFCAILIQGSDIHQVKAYSCKIDKYTWPSITTCTLGGLNLTTSEKHFQIVPNYDVNEIKGFRFRVSRLVVLTNDVCEVLPFLTHFRAKWLGLTSIEDNAFEKCTKLKVLELSLNSLTTLPTQLFASNEDLLEVYLYDNQLVELDRDLLQNNKNLVKIALQNNRLRSLSSDFFKNNQKFYSLSLNDNQLRELSFIEGMPVSVNLTEIDVRKNKLSDVDVEKLMEKGPNLKFIYLSGNEFLCKRKQELERLLLEKNVTTIDIEICIE